MSYTQKLALIALPLLFSSAFAQDDAYTEKLNRFTGNWQGEANNAKWQVTRNKDYSFQRSIEKCDDSGECQTITDKGIWNVYQSYFSYQYNLDDDEKHTEFYQYTFDENDNCLSLQSNQIENTPFADLIDGNTIKECRQ